MKKNSCRQPSGWILASLLLGIGGLQLPFVQAVELEVDSSHSTIGFAIKHLMISTVHGTFDEFSGVIDLDEKDMTRSKVNFTVKVDSIDTRNKKRDEHLRSAEFFDVQKFAEAKFVSHSIQKKSHKQEKSSHAIHSKDQGAEEYTMKGDMTLHGVTRPVVLDVVYSGKIVDPWGKTRHAFKAQTGLKRNDFNILWNKTLDAGGVMLGEEVSLDINIEAIAKAPAPTK